MPKFNPKHMKKITETKPMGLKSAKENCSVKGCSEEVSHHLAISNLEGYLGTLNWELNVDQKKNSRGALCKKHHKEYKKLKDKDDKWVNYKQFDAKKPTKDKPHYFLE